MSDFLRKDYLEWRLAQVAEPLGLEIRVAPLTVRRLHPFKPPKGPTRQLSAEHFAPIILPSRDDAQAEGKLYDIWRKIPGGHKWHHYFKTYTEVLQRLGSKPVRMLEIGVYRGGSARLWMQSLPAGSTFLGIDVNPDCAKFEYPDHNIFIRIGDQSDPIFLSQIVEEFGPFDFILDDGSHQCAHIIRTFDSLFLSGLTSPGVYLVEDTHTNFWGKFRYQSYSFIDLAKDLADLIHFHYFKHQSTVYFRKGHESRIGSASVPRISAEIDEIQFRDSLVVIYKRTKDALPMSEHL